MTDLLLLKNLFQNQAPPSSEKAIDECFDQIVECIEQENTAEAAKLIEKLFEKNVSDIRLIVYYFYAHFADYGIKSFELTLPLLTSFLNENWSQLTPKNRIEKHVQSSLNWFFSQVLLRLKFCEKLHQSGKLHPIWKKSVMEMTGEDCNQLIGIAKKFESFFLEKWPKWSVRERVLHLVKRIEEIGEIIFAGEKAAKPKETVGENLDQAVIDADDENLPVEEISQKEPALETNSTEEQFSEENDDFEQQNDKLEEQYPLALNDASDEAKVQRNGAAPVQWEECFRSLPFNIEKFEQLARKLKVFENLVEKNDKLKAAVVADDLKYLIEHFDPLEYFPKLFGNFFSLCAKHPDLLSESQNRDSKQVQALEKLYRSDLEMFLEW